MKITTLSELQRRNAARRSILSLPSYTLRRAESAARAAGKAVTTHTANTWIAASRYEPRPPLTARACASRPIAQKQMPAPGARPAASDDGWPHASFR
jgi:hypothetical protein